MDKLTLVIPAKHEKESLPLVLEELQKYHLKTIVVLEKEDHDTIFSISTNQNCNELSLNNIDVLAMGSRISDCVARACNRAVYEADSKVQSKPSWKKLFKDK